MGKESTRSSLDEKAPDANNSYTSAEEAALEKRVWLKLDLYILPVVTMFYLLSWLDRTNLGNARIAGLQPDLKINDTQYSIALTVTFIPYIASEIPCNLLLKVLGPDRVLPVLLLGWGIVTTFQGFIKNYAGLLACRFFIGLLEGGVLPGLVLYLSMLYPRRKLQTRISIFFSASSLAGAFSGLLATAIVKLHGRGGRPAWAWIFILEGLFTVMFGIWSFWLFPRDPEHCKFLTEQEKAYVVSELKKAQAISTKAQADNFNWSQVTKTFAVPHFWLLSCIYLLNGTIIFSLAYFIPTIVRALGYSPVRAQLMTVGPYAAAFVLTNVTSVIADRYKCRGLVSIFSSLCCVAGFAIYYTSTHKDALYGSLFLTVSGISCSSPALGAWVANNFAPHVRRATAIAALSMVTNSGGIFSTWLMASLSKPPRFRTGTITLLAFSSVMTVFCVITLAYLSMQNKKKEIARETAIKSEEEEDLGDSSPFFTYIL